MGVIFQKETKHQTLRKYEITFTFSRNSHRTQSKKALNTANDSRKPSLGRLSPKFWREEASYQWSQSWFCRGIWEVTPREPQTADRFLESKWFFEVYANQWVREALSALHKKSNGAVLKKEMITSSFCCWLSTLQCWGTSLEPLLQQDGALCTRTVSQRFRSYCGSLKK